ncbi:MAG: polyprenol monophosphomannose synthase [Flavobacteriales bacterium]|nr:polyprenol monophosphomannose synthase [Flavobacteriales bacterium]MDG1780871.1 polyprenol monophosphomannose synthase [Flavobacteriales bacterium]MDG2246704.1 polyprenol monophosphomannose synthase [Flavobacteriales bacterium]
MEDSLVIIPTYNEKENVERIIRKVFSFEHPFHILIVDDGSPDGTADIVKKLMQEFSGRLHILEREGKQGLGTAYIAGFRFGIEKKYDYIFEMDADFSHNPEDLIRLRQACVDGADFAIGSRYVKGGNVENWPKNRVLMSFFASVYVNTILWMGIRDCTAGFKCYKRAVLEAVELDKIRFIGYAFQIEMKYKAQRLGFKAAEVPITFIDRQFGESKMSMGIFKEAFWGVLRMRFMKVRRAN